MSIFIIGEIGLHHNGALGLVDELIDVSDHAVVDAA